MGLKEMGSSTNFDEALRNVIWVDAAVEARAKEGDKEVGALREFTRALLRDLDQQSPERRARIAAALQAQIEGRQAIVQLDGALRSFHNRLLGMCDLNREDERFTSFFKAPLSSMRRAGLAQRIERIRTTVTQLAQPTTPAALREEFDKPLAVALKAATAALARREAADRIEGESLRAFARWREQANQTLFGLDGRLRQIAASRGLGKAWVDAFFRPGKVRRSAGTVVPSSAMGVGGVEASTGVQPAASTGGRSRSAA